MPQSLCAAPIDRNGQVRCLRRDRDRGKGSTDALAAIVAVVLGIDAYDVRCVTGDTGLTPVEPRVVFQPRHRG